MLLYIVIRFARFTDRGLGSFVWVGQKMCRVAPSANEVSDFTYCISDKRGEWHGKQDN
jgi:hypothetical protein